MNNAARWKALTEEWVVKTGLSPGVLFTLAVQNIQDKHRLEKLWFEWCFDSCWRN